MASASTSQNGMARGSGGTQGAANASGSASAGEGNARSASATAPNASAAIAGEDASRPAKKKRHRGSKKKKNRRQSFLAPSEAPTEDTTTDGGERPSLIDASHHASQQDSFYRLQGRNRSNTSLESEALLDHREHAPVRSRRDTIKQGFSRVLPFARQQHRSSDASAGGRSSAPRSRLAYAEGAAISEGEDEEDIAHDRTPLLSTHRNRSRPELSRNNSALGPGGYGSQGGFRGPRRASKSSAASSRRGFEVTTVVRNTLPEEPHDVNNPPSMPGSPQLGSMDDIFIAGLGPASDRGRDAVVNLGHADDGRYSSISPEGMRRRPTIADLAERDVCFPEEMDGSDHDHESPRPQRGSSTRPRRRRTRRWPDLDILEEWSREEKEERTNIEVQRAKKISEPIIVGGRLRPAKTVWHRDQGDSPFRFTYFNENLDGTIHARTISDLQDGMTFHELFLPDPVELSDSSDDEDTQDRPSLHERRVSNEGSVQNPSIIGDVRENRAASIAKSAVGSAPASGHATPKPSKKRHGPRPTFWLDVLSPTETEMKVLSKAFGIHQLTSEDILMDEPREKVELFPSYYFVNYRTFEQDKDSEDYMDPINIYVVVFRDGVISFHHSMSPHPANVRRRIRQLNDYMSPTADWISYAIIDDITDVYAPLVSEIENEVDDIDEEILYMHSASVDAAERNKDKKQSQDEQRPKTSKSHIHKNILGTESRPRNSGDASAAKTEVDNVKPVSAGGDMLRRVGECRKKVMALYRLLGNKADVIKGFAKRCNEHWEVAPRSEIGLYLGDIQDHIVTMTGNLSHYESLLSRAHSNYVAQINIRMNERAEANADVLGKLTVLGTIVLPMNIITGMWGMNVWVPGQDVEGDLTWFFGITAGLFMFGVCCYLIARKVYGIV